MGESKLDLPTFWPYGQRDQYHGQQGDNNHNNEKGHDESGVGIS